MEKIDEYKDYLLYHEDEQARDINNSSGSRYIRNSILIFRPKEKKIIEGRHIGVYDTVENAKKHIDDLCREPIKEVMKNATQRSKEIEQQIQQRANEHTEIERRKNERQAESYNKKRTDFF